MSELNRHAREVLPEATSDILCLIQEFRDARQLDEDFDQELNKSFLVGHWSYIARTIYDFLDDQGLRRDEIADLFCIIPTGVSQNRKAGRLTGPQLSAIKIEFPEFHADLHCSPEIEENAKRWGYVSAIQSARRRTSPVQNGTSVGPFTLTDFDRLRGLFNSEQWIRDFLSGATVSGKGLLPVERRSLGDWGLPFLVSVYSLTE